MNVKLTVSVAMQQKSLLISCTITNNETRRIGVFSRIQRVNLDGSRNLDIANCYIDLEGEKLVLRKYY